MMVIDKHNPGWLHYYIYFLLLLLNENISDGLLKVSWMLSTVPPMPKDGPVVHPPVPESPCCTWLEVMWYMTTVLPHFVLVYSENIDGPKYCLRSNHLLFFFLIRPLCFFPDYCALRAFHKFSANSCTVKTRAAEGAFFSVAALAHVISAALWDWLWKDIKVNTLLSSATL